MMLRRRVQCTPSHWQAATTSLSLPVPVLEPTSTIASASGTQASSVRPLQTVPVPARARAGTGTVTDSESGIASHGGPARRGRAGWAATWAAAVAVATTANRDSVDSESLPSRRAGGSVTLPSGDWHWQSASGSGPTGRLWQWEGPT